MASDKGKKSAKTVTAIPANDDGTEKKRALDIALAGIEKQFGKGAVIRMGERAVRDIQVIPTGCLDLDMALGVGGVPRGRVVEIYGPESSGKTTLALLPAALAPPDARGVWADTQISGGELEAYLRALLAVWGARLWVWLDPICMRFPVPCPTGVGEALTASAVQAVCARHPSHFSPALLCRYCFFSGSEGRPSVVLFDTDDTCREKLALLRRLGVQQVFGFLPQG